MIRSQVNVKMDPKSLHIVVSIVSLLHAESAVGLRTAMGCSSTPPTQNWPCFSNHTLNQSSTVYLDCDVKNKTPEASWWKTNQNKYSCLELAQRGLNRTFLHENFTLELRNVSLEDNGMYLCILLEDTIAVHCVFIIAIPTLMITANGTDSFGTLAAVLGEKYELSCAAFGADRLVNLTWSYNNQINNVGESVPSEYCVGNATNGLATSLEFTAINAGSINVTCSSSGRYPEQKIISTLQVETYAIPTLFVNVNNEKSNGTLLAVLHRKYDLKCIAHGAYPMVNLTWKYEDENHTVDEDRQSGRLFFNQTFDSVISLGYTSNQTGSSNITCLSNGKYPAQDLRYTLNVKVYAIPTVLIEVDGKNSTTIVHAALRTRYILRCVALDADPAVNLSWSYNNHFYNVEENISSNNIGNNENYVTLGFTAEKTGFSNITCHTTGMYPEQNVNFTMQVEAYAPSSWTYWFLCFGIAIFLVLIITTVFVVRYQIGKRTSETFIPVSYRGNRLSSKTSTFESLRKRDSGSMPLIEMRQRDDNFGDNTIDKVAREDVSVMTSLPSKSFLKYFKGNYSRSGKRGYVLVKTVKEYAYVKDIYTFAKCSRLMELLPNHENVVKFLGISNDEMPIYSYHEYVECITLRNYMLRNYQSSGLSTSSTCSRNSYAINKNCVNIELYVFAENVANGMNFLTSQNFNHPALSLRKVLVSLSGQCKLYDIWPEAMLPERIRYLLQRKDPPLPWIAPECIFLGQYYLNTDVWSYGVFLWELFSFGETPFKNMSTFEIENEVRNSRNLPIPWNCPGAIVSLMLSSWNKDAEKRPHFDQILQRLHCVLKSIEQESHDQSEDDVILERTSQYHKYFTLERQSTEQ